MMSPELERILERTAQAEQAETARTEAMLDTHRMAYRTRRSALMATSTFTRPRQL